MIIIQSATTVHYRASLESSARPARFVVHYRASLESSSRPARFVVHHWASLESSASPTRFVVHCRGSLANSARPARFVQHVRPTYHHTQLLCTHCPTPVNGIALQVSSAGESLPGRYYASPHLIKWPSPVVGATYQLLSSGETLAHRQLRLIARGIIVVDAMHKQLAFSEICKKYKSVSVNNKYVI